MDTFTDAAAAAAAAMSDGSGQRCDVDNDVDDDDDDDVDDGRADVLMESGASLLPTCRTTINGNSHQEYIQTVQLTTDTA